MVHCQQQKCVKMLSLLVCLLLCHDLVEGNNSESTYFREKTKNCQNCCAFFLCVCMAVMFSHLFDICIMYNSYRDINGLAKRV